MADQVTISRPVRVDGVNVYNGRPNSAVFCPAEENSGLAFLVEGARVPALLGSAENMRRAVSLDSGEKKAYLVEHLLSAVYALGIDNLTIGLADGVCPTTENCAREYLEALKDIRVSQPAPKRFWRYAGNRETRIRNYKKRKPDCLKVSSSEGFVIDYLVYYPHKVIREQSWRFRFDEQGYTDEISRARSPGFMKNRLFSRAFLLLGKRGLHGINERNYLLITSERAERHANPEGFEARYDGQEFVRHKILDVLGTLALTGRQFADTCFRFEMTGHRFDIYALKKMFSERCFEDYAPSE